jgi:hypothetical protein
VKEISVFKVTGTEVVRAGTAKVYVRTRAGELQVTVYPSPLPMRVFAPNSSVQWLQADLSAAQQAKVRAAASAALRAA